MAFMREKYILRLRASSQRVEVKPVIVSSCFDAHHDERVHQEEEEEEEKSK